MQYLATSRFLRNATRRTSHGGWARRDQGIEGRSRDRPPFLNSQFLSLFPQRKMLSLLNQIEQSGLATSIHESGSLWGYPLILFLHTLGFGTLVGLNAAIDLRLLGFGAGIPLKSFEKTFRLMWGGFVLNAATGSLLF